MPLTASLRRALFALGLVTVAGGVLSEDAHAGTAMNISNQTGHAVTAFLFADGKVHTRGDGGIQLGPMADGETKAIDVPSCDFSIVMVAGDETWHAEFHDCESNHRTVFADSGRGQR